jgi:hypothetical protein
MGRRSCFWAKGVGLGLTILCYRQVTGRTRLVIFAGACEKSRVAGVCVDALAMAMPLDTAGDATTKYIRVNAGVVAATEPKLYRKSGCRSYILEHSIFRHS